MSDQNKVIVRRFLEEPHLDNLTVVDEVLAPTAIIHDPGRHAPPPGPEGQKQAIINVLSAFPDFRFTGESVLAENDKVAIRSYSSTVFMGRRTQRFLRRN